MSKTVQTNSADVEATAAVPSAPSSGAPESWRELRENGDIQFEPVETIPPPIGPQEPGWFLKALQAFFEFLGDLLGPVGALIGGSWPILQWVLLGLVIAFVLYLVARTIGPLARKRKVKKTAER